MTHDTAAPSLLDEVIVDFARREGHSRTLSDALYIFAAISNAGLVVLPAKPTRAMLEAGAAAGGVSTERVRAILCAVIQAAD